MSAEMIGKVLIFIFKETDMFCWLLLNQTGNAEQAMTGNFFSRLFLLPFDCSLFSSCAERADRFFKGC